MKLDYLAKDGNYHFRGIMPWPECARAKASPLFSLLGQLQLHFLDRAYNQNFHYNNFRLQGQEKIPTNFRFFIISQETACKYNDD